jgi:hypothetical protein
MSVARVEIGLLSVVPDGTSNPCSSMSSVVEKEIVRRLEALFALADQIEARLEAAGPPGDGGV